jgi:hypothetical protein
VTVRELPNSVLLVCAHCNRRDGEETGTGCATDDVLAALRCTKADMYP